MKNGTKQDIQHYLTADFVGCNINGLLPECTPSSRKERKAQPATIEAVSKKEKKN